MLHDYVLLYLLNLLFLGQICNPKSGDNFFVNVGGQTVISGGEDRKIIQGLIEPNLIYLATAC